MNNTIILTAHNKPFKSLTNAEKAIKDKEGYVVEEVEGGFAGVYKYKHQSYPDPPITITIPVPLKKDRNGIIEEYQRGIVSLKEDIRTELFKNLSGLDVLCPQCGLSHNETTENYNPDVLANPSMIKLKKVYKDNGWEELPRHADASYGLIECSECGAPLAPAGKFKVREIQPQ